MTLMAVYGSVPADGHQDPRRLGPPCLRVDLPRAEETGLVLEFAQQTRAGISRDNNEDAIGCWAHSDGLLVAVADGVGGCENGEVASRRAIDVLVDSIAETPSSWLPRRRLRHGVERANLAVHDPTSAPMATTLTATLFTAAGLATAHVGDCRLLRLRNGVLEQLTSDHNVAGRLASLGLLSAEGRATHPGRRTVTRCLGQEPFVRVDLVAAALQPGDIYLQCSDGIGHLTGRQITEVLIRHDPQTAAAMLVERGLDAGAGDDTSVQVTLVVSCASAPEPAGTPLFSRLAALFRR